MGKVQVLKDKRGKPTHAVIPWNDYKALKGGFDEDTALVELGEVAKGDELLPADAMKKIVFGGESAVKVVRELRRLSQRELAEKVGSSSAYISQIENGRPAGRVMLSKLSKALSVPVDLLLSV